MSVIIRDLLPDTQYEAKVIAKYVFVLIIMLISIFLKERDTIKYLFG